MSLPAKSSRRLWRWVALIVLLLLAALGILMSFILSSTHGLSRMKKLVRNQFPEVIQLSTTQVASMIADPSTRPLVLDVREKVEFETSHLPGAIQVDPEANISELEKLISTHRHCVLYCSVGYRSSRLAQQLMDVGVTNVSNMEGSIFQWANEGRAMETHGKPTTMVHPYNQTFGRLLKPEHRARVPAVH